MSQTKPYDLIVFIGRFQPFHIGHLEVIQTAFKQTDRLLVLFGSANQPRTIKNPWTTHERYEMLERSIPKEMKGEIFVRSLRDSPYSDQEWARNVQQRVDEIKALRGLSADAKVAIIGHTKDDTSYYLKMFPQWAQLEHELNELVNATDIRNIMFSGQSLKYMAGVLTEPVMQMVTQFKSAPEFELLQREFNMIAKYHKSWAAAPYAPTFVTTDAIVVQSGHVLVIERGAAPGEGLLAVPGGFLEQKERLLDGMIRELREETKLKVPGPVLRGSIVKTQVFDKPDRSMRGRTITHAYLIELPPGPLPEIKGSDDARAAFWIPISQLDESKFFEDHYAMITTMLGLS